MKSRGIGGVTVQLCAVGSQRLIGGRCRRGREGAHGLYGIGEQLHGVVVVVYAPAPVVARACIEYAFSSTRSGSLSKGRVPPLWRWRTCRLACISNFRRWPLRAAGRLRPQLVNALLGPFMLKVWASDGTSGTARC